MPAPGEWGSACSERCGWCGACTSARGDEEDRRWIQVDIETKRALVTKLRALSIRKRLRTDPPGCFYCGDEPQAADNHDGPTGSLCANCLDRLERLSASSR